MNNTYNIIHEIFPGLLYFFLRYTDFLSYYIEKLIFKK